MNSRIREMSNLQLVLDPVTPAEIAATAGVAALSNQALYQLLGISKPEQIEWLNRVGGPLGAFTKPWECWIEDGNFTFMTALKVKAAVELGRRAHLESVPEKYIINSPADAAALVQYEMAGLEHEELWVICLNTRNHVIRVERLLRGSANSAQVSVGEIFKAALRLGATAIVVVHNHPSGDPTPSPDDAAVTRSIVQAGKLININMLDHVVIGGSKWISLKERGLGFN